MLCLVDWCHLDATQVRDLLWLSHEGATHLLWNSKHDAVTDRLVPSPVQVGHLLLRSPLVLLILETVLVVEVLLVLGCRRGLRHQDL